MQVFEINSSYITMNVTRGFKAYKNMKLLIYNLNNKN